jgi:putative endonuclease
MIMTDSVPQTDPRKQLGAAGEELAARALQDAGLAIRERNWRCAAGELDIVALETAPDYARGGDPVPWLVAVEVRTRRGTRYGSALQSITPAKQAKLREVTAHYVQAEAWPGPWRIDVVAVQMDERGRLQSIQHIRHAVGG